MTASTKSMTANIPTPGSKYDKALKLGIEIWNEEKLKEVIDNL